MDRRQFKTILLPMEHGAWGFLIEAILVGLILAPTIAGFCLTWGIGSAFFTGQAARFYINGYKKRITDSRVPLAGKLAVGLAFITMGIFIFVYGFHPSAFPLILFIALLILLVQGFVAFYSGKKSLPSELLGGIALGFPSAAIITMGTKPLTIAYLAWGLLALRAVTSTIYIRHQLRKARGQGHSQTTVAAVHVFALGLVSWLAFNRLCSWAALAGMLILTGRALFGIYGNIIIPPKQIGLGELGWGVLYMIFITGGFIVD